MKKSTNGPLGAREKPRFVDLFCGAGLLSYGFKSSGFDPVLAVDLDTKAVRSYNQNIKNCAVTADVTIVHPHIDADVIIAGPPCQGFSTLGRRDPKDARNELGLCIADWAETISPKIIVIENVPGFIQTLWFEKISKRLVSLGYKLQVFVLDAIDFGAAQRRKRAFTIASKVGPISEPKKRRAKPRSFRDVVMNQPIDPNDPMHIWPNPSELALKRFNAIPQNGGKRELLRSHPELCPQSWLKIPGEATDVWGRIDPDNPTNTIRCSFQNPSKGRYIHPFENRVISLREGARLQGIPDKWILAGEATPIARQIGNGVPIALGKALAKQILLILAQNAIPEAAYSAAA